MDPAAPGLQHGARVDPPAGPDESTPVHAGDDSAWTSDSGSGNYGNRAYGGHQSMQKGGIFMFPKFTWTAAASVAVLLALLAYKQLDKVRNGA